MKPMLQKRIYWFLHRKGRIFNIAVQCGTCRGRNCRISLCVILHFRCWKKWKMEKIRTEAKLLESFVRYMDSPAVVVQKSGEQEFFDGNSRFTMPLLQNRKVSAIFSCQYWEIKSLNSRYRVNRILSILVIRALL